VIRRAELEAGALHAAAELVKGALGGQALEPEELRRAAERVVRAVQVGKRVRSGPKGGRPKVEGTRPWEALEISRRTWERRRKAAEGK
jgi:hypothetical protein